MDFNSAERSFENYEDTKYFNDLHAEELKQEAKEEAITALAARIEDEISAEDKDTCEWFMEFITEHKELPLIASTLRAYFCVNQTALSTIFDQAVEYVATQRYEKEQREAK